MKKNLLIALALPAIFAACSQEDIISEGNSSANALGTPAGKIDFFLNEDVDSRMSWGTTGNPAWDAENDAFSLFWVGAKGTNNTEKYSEVNVYKSATNALYQREDGGAFTSKNIVYVGNHVIVYPADYAHVEDQKILVSVGSSQDASKELGLRSVYVSDLLEIAKKPTDPSEIKADVMYAGYNEPVVADVAALSSNMVLKLNFKMNDNINEVKIKSIVLESNKKIFAHDGYLTLNDDNYMTLVPNAVGETVTLVMPEGTKVTKNSPTYTAQIALLPPVAEQLNGATYKIIVNTNFGFVTIDKAMLVTNSAGKYQIAEGTGYDATKVETINEKTQLSFYTEFSDIAKREVDNKATADEDESESSYGKRFTRNVAVDMATAEIDGMKIANSQDLIDAYQVYDLLEKGKDDNVSFELVGEAWKEGATIMHTFDLNPAAASAVAAHEYVTLTLNEKMDTLALVKGTSAFTAVPDLSKALGDYREELHLNLCAGDWNLNVKDAKIVNAYKEIHNLGNLIITDVATTNGVALNKVICNENTVTFSGTVNMPVAYNQIKGGTTNVGSAAKVNLNAGGSINGEVDVDGKLAANKGVVNIATEAELAVSGSLLTASTGTMNNLGTITLEGTGTTIVSANEDGAVMGSIVLAARNSSAKVNNSQKQGYIKWNCDEDEYRRLLTDAFNCLVLSQDVSFRQGQQGTSEVKHIEVAGTKLSINASMIDYNQGDLVLNLTSVKVNQNSTLVVPIGTDITTTNTIKGGDIEVYGKYIAGTETGNGTIYYFNGQVNVATEAALFDAVKNAKDGDNIVITSDMNLTAPLSFGTTVAKGNEEVNISLDLNGKNITSDVTAIVVNNSKLTITGKGKVSGGKGGSYNAIRVNANAEVVIKDGTYTVGGDENGEGNATIYAYGGGKITITGGEFSSEKYYNAGRGNVYFVVNGYDTTVKPGNIQISGGKFLNFNPQKPWTETDENVSFLAEITGKTFRVKAESGSTNATKAYPESETGKAGKDNWYEVYEYVAAE